MSDSWITSWYWSWRPIAAPPPGVPQAIPSDRAEHLGRLARLALDRQPDDSGAGFLALAHERLAREPGVEQLARVEYRVSSRVRFPHREGARGSARRAIDHVTRLESLGQLAPTRGPYHLSEILAQGGLALITLRADVLQNETEPRLATFVPVASTRGGGPMEPMHLGLFEPARDRVVWTQDDALARAWHAPMAGGEILAILPGIAMPPRTRSGANLRAVDSGSPVGSAGRSPRSKSGSR